MATISAHNDQAIGELVADAMEKVGDEGVITVEESKTTETALEVVEGMQFDRGFISPYFITNPEKMEAVLEDAFIVLICDRKIAVLKDLLPLLEQIVKVGRPLLVIAEDVEGEALATLDRQSDPRRAEELRRQGAGLRRPPQGHAAGHRGAHRRAGRFPRSSASSWRVSRSTSSGGQARRRSTRTTRPSSAAPATSKAIDGRVQQIRREIEETTSDYDKEKLRERLAKLAGGVAVIRVGAPAESEMKAKKEALDDAISATKAAVAEGIVPGGGLALLRCIEAVAARGGAGGGRRADRHPDPEAGAGGAGPADRREFRRRWRRGRGARCWTARAISASTRRASSMSIWSRPASSIRPRSCASRWRTPCRSRACCS